jgi:hypothetical protein
MNADEVREYVERSQQLIEASPQMDEENTKVRLVQPFLELLGWDLYSTEVELEYTVPMASGSTHVDYALLVGDSPVAFVEAKPVRSDLSDGSIRQLKSYMRQELDVDWGILTNGKAFEVLTKSRHQNSGEEVSVVRFDLDDLAGNPDMLELLSKESIRSGRADEIADQVAQTNEAIRYLQENESEVAEAVTDTVEREVGNAPIDIEEQARQFVQDLVSVLREQRQFVGESSPDIDFWDHVEQKIGIKKRDDEIHLNQELLAVENFEVFVQLLFNEGYLTKEDLPYSGGGSTRYLLNTEPVHQNGSEMYNSHEIIEGIFLETHNSTDDKKRYMKKFVSDFVDS